MALDWITAGKVALAAGQAFLAHLQARADDAERERDRALILEAIKQAREEILDRLNVLEVNELKGELEGFRLTYASYDADPSDPAEEARLVTLIDDSARVLGRLGSHLDSVGANPALALEAWAVYVPLLYLRAQAMTEREATFGAEESREALLSFDMGIPRLQGLLAYLRAQNDNQFGPIVCRPVPDSQDSAVCWYWWGNEQFVCGSTRDPRGVDKCRRSRAANMESSYRAFPGVREITLAGEQMQIARDALDTTTALDLLGRRGVDVGEIVIRQGRFAVARPPAASDVAPGPIAPASSWLA